jgi:hypothetical protein
MKLPAHPVRTGQARRGFPEMKYHPYCAPSCLPVGRNPAYKAGLSGHLPANLRR